MVKTRRHYHRKVKGKSRKGQKIYIMKGCSKGVSRQKSVRQTKTFSRQKGLMRKNSLKRGIRQSIGLTGGNCTTCLNGGSTVNPLVGAPWSATDGQAQQSSNHYAQNMYKVDPQMMMEIRGGRGSRGRGSRGKGSRGRGLKGGTLMNLIPSDLVNLGRDLTFNVNSAYSSLTGATQPVNPSVTEGQLQSSVNLNKIIV